MRHSSGSTEDTKLLSTLPCSPCGGYDTHTSPKDVNQTDMITVLSPMFSPTVSLVDSVDINTHNTETSSLVCENVSSILMKFRKKHKKQFTFGHLNVNSFRWKFAELSDELLSNNVLDLVFFSESKLDSSFPPAQFSVPGFRDPLLELIEISTVGVS